jgi:hypothetical protein
MQGLAFQSTTVWIHGGEDGYMGGDTGRKGEGRRGDPASDAAPGCPSSPHPPRVRPPHLGDRGGDRRAAGCRRAGESREGLGRAGVSTHVPGEGYTPRGYMRGLHKHCQAYSFEKFPPSMGVPPERCNRGSGGSKHYLSYGTGKIPNRLGDPPKRMGVTRSKEYYIPWLVISMTGPSKKA